MFYRFKKKKKMGMNTFDVATRTSLHFCRVDQGYLFCYFPLKTFKDKKNRSQPTDCETNLDLFFFKNIATSLAKDRIVNFRMIDLFTPGLSDCQNAFSILREVFNSVEEVTLSIIRDIRTDFF